MRSRARASALDGTGQCPAGLVAGVTVYRPDAALLLRLLETLAADGLATTVHVDGPVGVAIEASLLSDIAAIRGVTILQPATNVGIGRGLNAIAVRARECGASRLLYFDQDSSPVSGLGQALDERMTRLVAVGERIAVVGPRIVAPVGEESQSPRYRFRDRPPSEGGLRAVDFVITSGSLVSLDAWEEIGPFREDYRIDGIDLEWCFRAWSRGWSVRVADDLDMPHRLGSGVIRLGPVGFPRQRLERLETYMRNQIHGLRLAHVPLRWKLRTLLYVPVQAVVYSAVMTPRAATAKRLAAAMANGLRGRFRP